jgi:hypothetical protein
MKIPFVPDVVKVKKNTSLLYLAMLFILIINGASFVLPPHINSLVVPILAIIVGYICGRSQYDMTGNYASSVVWGIAAAFVLIDILVVLYIFIRNQKFINGYEKNTPSL